MIGHDGVWEGGSLENGCGNNESDVRISAVSGEERVAVYIESNVEGNAPGSEVPGCLWRTSCHGGNQGEPGSLDLS